MKLTKYNFLGDFGHFIWCFVIFVLLLQHFKHHKES